MADTKEPKKEIDPLDQLIKADIDQHPAPKLSGVAKASIMDAIEEQATIASPLDQLAELLGDIFKPVGIAALSVAGISGLAIGALATPTMVAELSIEEEFASYYESTILFDDLSQDQLSDGAL